MFSFVLPYLGYVYCVRPALQLHLTSVRSKHQQRTSGDVKLSTLLVVLHLNPTTNPMRKTKGSESKDVKKKKKRRTELLKPYLGFQHKFFGTLRSRIYFVETPHELILIVRSLTTFFSLTSWVWQYFNNI